jgi:hypothetical protein
MILPIMPNSFISLEDEIMLRRAVRSVYQNEGLVGVFTAMGELARSLEIFGEVAKELIDEEDKNKKGK